MPEGIEVPARTVSFSLEDLGKDWQYLRQLLLEYRSRGSLEEVARRFGRSPISAQRDLERIGRSMEVEGSIKVLECLQIGLAAPTFN